MHAHVHQRPVQAAEGDNCLQRGSCYALVGLLSAIRAQSGCRPCDDGKCGLGALTRHLGPSLSFSMPCDRAQCTEPFSANPLPIHSFARSEQQTSWTALTTTTTPPPHPPPYFATLQLATLHCPVHASGQAFPSFRSHSGRSCNCIRPSPSHQLCLPVHKPCAAPRKQPLELASNP